MASHTLPKGIRLMRGRFQARIRHQGRDYVQTWDTEAQAIGWMQRTRRELDAGTFAGLVVEDPDTRRPLPPMLGDYAATWVAERDLKPRTRAEYERMLEHFQALDKHRLDQISRDQVKRWYTSLKLAPVAKKHTYELLRAIFNTAVDDEHIDVSPVRIRGAAKTRKAPLDNLPTAVKVHELADRMPTAKYRVMVLMSAWCGLRFGEATELRRKDIISDDGGVPIVVRVRRGVVRVGSEHIVGTPKSAAGMRDVTIPPHIRSDVQNYLQTLPSGPENLIFPATRTGRHMQPSSLYKPFYAAREAVGLPTLRWHDLRHFSATTAAQTGATLAELQARLGHSTVHAAMRYQHAVSGADQRIAEAMSNVVTLKPRTA